MPPMIGLDRVFAQLTEGGRFELVDMPGVKFARRCHETSGSFTLVQVISLIFMGLNIGRNVRD